MQGYGPVLAQKPMIADSNRMDQCIPWSVVNGQLGGQHICGDLYVCRLTVDREGAEKTLKEWNPFCFLK